MKKPHKQKLIRVVWPKSEKKRTTVPAPPAEPNWRELYLASLESTQVRIVAEHAAAAETVLSNMNVIAAYHGALQDLLAIYDRVMDGDSSWSPADTRRMLQIRHLARIKFLDSATLAALRPPTPITALGPRAVPSDAPNGHKEESNAKS